MQVREVVEWLNVRSPIIVRNLKTTKDTEIGLHASGMNKNLLELARQYQKSSHHKNAPIK